MKSVKFFTLGCKVNQYETQKIREGFLQRGFKESGNGDPADICVINTCTVTHQADADSLNFIRRALKGNPCAKIIVTGCLSELDAKRIRDISRKIAIVKNRKKESISARLISHFAGHARAFLKVQDGCDNFCSYCKVPLVRGRSRSRGIQAIIREARALVKHGHREIVLCGICLGSYGKDLAGKPGLVELIDRLEQIDGLARIRLSSIEAHDVSDDLVEKMAHSEKLCRHLHIPLQSGDDEVLKKMNRRYDVSGYLTVITKIRQRVPDAGISTDVLVGFPGEGERNFKNTLEVVKKIAPLRVHAFPYSNRKGTFAGDNLACDEIKPLLVKARLARLKDAAEACASRCRKASLGAAMIVLIEERVSDNPGWWEGYTDTYLSVRIKSSLNLQNQMVSAKLKTDSGNYILGEMLHIV